MQLTVWMLQLSVALGFVVAGLLLLKLVGPDLRAVAGVIMLGLANPLLILWAVLAGAHNDVDRGDVRGDRAGRCCAGTCSRPASCWGSRAARSCPSGWSAWRCCGRCARNRRKMLQIVWAAGVAMVGLYAFVGLQRVPAGAVADVVHLDRHAAQGDLNLLDLAMPGPVVRTLVGDRGLDRADHRRDTALPGVPEGPVPQGVQDDVTPDAIRYTAIYAIAWLLTAMYTLPWYDLIAWVALAVVGASRVDQLMVIRTAMLAWPTYRAGTERAAMRHVAVAGVRQHAGCGTRSAPLIECAAAGRADRLGPPPRRPVVAVRLAAPAPEPSGARPVIARGRCWRQQRPLAPPSPAGRAPPRPLRRRRTRAAR